MFVTLEDLSYVIILLECRPTCLQQNNNTEGFCLLKWPFLHVLCRFCKDFSIPRVTEGFGSLQCFNIQGVKYDDPPLREVENSMAHPIGKAENIVTHPRCAPAHPHLYLLTSP